MNSNELIRKLKEFGVQIDATHGKGSHTLAVLNGKSSFVPRMERKKSLPGPSTAYAASWASTRRIFETWNTI